MGKPAPTYWWDYRNDDKGGVDVIVQTDYPGGDCLARFPVLGKYSDNQVQQAGQLISDCKAGRKTPQWNKEGE